LLPTKKWKERFTEEVKKEGQEDAAYQQAWNEVEAALPKEQRIDRKARSVLEIRNELLYRKGMLWVPEGLVQKILESEHDTKVAQHMGQDKTIELIRRNFWWPKMNERIIDFV